MAFCILGKMKIPIYNVVGKVQRFPSEPSAQEMSAKIKVISISTDYVDYDATTILLSDDKRVENSTEHV